MVIKKNANGIPPPTAKARPVRLNRVDAKKEIELIAKINNKSPRLNQK